MILLSMPAWGATATVPGSHDSVIAACNDANIDLVEVSASATMGDGTCNLSRTVRFVSTSGARLPPIHATGAQVTLEGVVFKVEGSTPALNIDQSSLVAKDVEITWVNGPGQALYMLDGEVTFEEVLVQGFEVDNALDVYAFQSGASFSAIRSTFADNVAKLLYVGAGYGYPVVVEFEASEVSGNRSTSYGPIELQGDVTMTATDSLFDGNAGQTGGAVHVGAGGSLTVYGGAFVANEAGSDGGAIYAYDSPVTLSGVLFQANTSEGYGGAVNVEYGATLTSYDSWFLSNAAKGGGAVMAEGDLYVDGGMFCANGATLNVGTAITQYNAVSEVSWAVFLGHDGTALYGSGMSRTDVEHVSFVHNVTALDPGTGDLDLRHSLFWGNAEPLANSATAAQYETNAFDARPSFVPSTQLEIDDPLFLDAFLASWDTGSCDVLPYPRWDSPLVGAASDGGPIGALDTPGADSGTWTDSGTWVDSGIDSPDPADSGTPDSDVPEPVDPVVFVTGGCRGPAGAFLLLGIALVARTFRARAD